MKSSSLTVAMLCVLAPSAPAFAQYAEAIVASERAMAEVANLAAEARNEAMAGNRADEIRTRVTKATDQFVQASQELNQELDRLQADKTGNAAQIAQLQKARARADKAKERLKALNGLMTDDKTMINAVKSKHLERTLKEVASAMHEVGESVKGVHTALESTGNEQVGSVEITSLKVTQGKMVFFMKEGFGGGEKELREGMTVRVEKLPIVIRASILDEQKQRLTEMKEKGASGETHFEDATDMTPGHKFVYGNPRVGTSTWIAHEEYVWTPESREKIRGLAQRSSDGATRPTTGDLVEIHTAGAVAQGLKFDVTGKCVRWERQSKLAGGNRTQDVVPKDASAQAHIVLSVFPR